MTVYGWTAIFFLDIPYFGIAIWKLNGNMFSAISERLTMLDAKADLKKSPLSPPYVSFLTLKTLLKSFQEHGTPSRIDRSVLPNFSGAVAGQLIPALRFLGLIDSANHSTDQLKDLVTAYGTDAWPACLKGVLDDTYLPLTKIDLQTASPSQFDEAFQKAYPAPDAVSRKCKTFYLAGAAEAKKPISPYIMRNKKPRSGPTKKRTAKSNGGKNGNNVRQPPAFENPPSQPELSLSQMVLETLDMKKMSEAEQDALWVYLKYLRKEGK